MMSVLQRMQLKYVTPSIMKRNTYYPKKNETQYVRYDELTGMNVNEILVVLLADVLLAMKCRARLVV